MKIMFHLFFVCLFTSSCSNKKGESNPSVSYNYSLEKKGKTLTYNISSDVDYRLRVLFPYTDLNGKEYITFQNSNEPEILIYQKEKSELFLKLDFPLEGPQSVGRFLGYHIESFDEIYLTGSYRQQITKVDTAKNILDIYLNEKTDDGHPLIPHKSTSLIYSPLVKIRNKLYIAQRFYPGLSISETYLAATIDLNSRSVKRLPFVFPPFLPNDIDNNKVIGHEHSYSRCYADSMFIYSFYSNEDIYIASIDHTDIKRIPVKSKYIHALEKTRFRPDDMQLGVKIACEIPIYGNLIHDPYRNVYYRFAYPATEMEDGVNYIDVNLSGRKKFSIIILDKDFNIIGETLFPEYTYISSQFFVDEDGLYLGSNHFKRTDFDEDVLKFECFELVKK